MFYPHFTLFSRCFSLLDCSCSFHADFIPPCSCNVTRQCGWLPRTWPMPLKLVSVAAARHPRRAAWQAGTALRAPEDARAVCLVRRVSTTALHSCEAVGSVARERL
ncbi:hypothetical protein TRVL_06556 [Trypanosoma vivax]|nr:hypothetical protein TRVL_06556 [Trypanosoma vivax]